MGLKILGTGSALPSNMVTNEQLTKMVDTSDEWIASRTGIRQRHISTGETTTELCVRAARRALENAGMQAEELELIVVDDASTDDTAAVMTAITDPRVRYVRKEHGGAAAARGEDGGRVAAGRAGGRAEEGARVDRAARLPL